MTRRFMTHVVLYMVVLILVACKGATISAPSVVDDHHYSKAKALTSYSFPGLAATGFINESAKTISVTVPYGTNVTALIATFQSTGASVKVGSKVQISGTTPNDFTNPVPYTVTAADSSSAVYTVTVNIRALVANATPLRVTGADQPLIGIDDSDNIFAVWSASPSSYAYPDGNAYAIRYSLNSWETPAFIGDSDPGRIIFLRLAVSPNGSAFAAWYKTNGNVYAARYVPGTGWESPEILAGIFTILDLQITADAMGNAIVIWEQPDMPYYRLYARRYVPGTGWNAAQTIDDNTGHCIYPRIVADSTGNAIAIWQGGNFTSRIYANRFTAGSSWGTPALVSSSTSTAAFAPEIAINKSGSAMAVWYEDDNGTYNAYARSFTPGMGWAAVQSIETGTSDAFYVDVAMDDAGTAIALWRQPDLYFNRYEPGSGWNTAEALASRPVGGAVVEMNGQGQAVAAWAQLVPAMGIYSNKFSLATGWGAPSNLASEPGDPNAANAVMDSQGNAMVIWSQTIDTGWGSPPTTAVFTKTF